MSRKSSARQEAKFKRKSIIDKKGKKRKRFDSSSGSDDDDGKLYCICKKPYNSNIFMIACDVCDDWFHGSCVSISEVDAEKIKTYICPPCRKKRLSNSTTPKSKEAISNSKMTSINTRQPGKSSPTTPTSPAIGSGKRGLVSPTPPPAKKAKTTSKTSKSPTKSSQKKTKSSVSNHSPKNTTYSPHTTSQQSTQNISLPLIKRLKATATSLGNPNELPKPCKNNNCNKMTAPPSKYCSPDCGLEVGRQLVAIKQELLRQQVNGSNNTARINIEQPPGDVEKTEVGPSDDRNTKDINNCANSPPVIERVNMAPIPAKKRKFSEQQMGQVYTVKQPDTAKNCDVGALPVSIFPEQCKQAQNLVETKDCINVVTLPEDTKNTVPGSDASHQTQIAQDNEIKTTTVNEKHSTGLRDSLEIKHSAILSHLVDNFSPLKKALEHNTISHSDHQDLVALKHLEEKKGTIMQKLNDLEQQKIHLEKDITFANNLILSEEDFKKLETSTKSNQKNGMESLAIVDCLTCGLPIPGKTFPRHAEQCFSKKEGGAYTCSHKLEPYTNDAGVLISYCNYYDSRSGGYCNREQGNCIFHTQKKKKIQQNQLCGCRTSDFESGYCERLKKSCMKHVNWEKIREMELAQELLRQKDVFEEVEREIIRTQARIKRRMAMKDEHHHTVEESVG